MFIKFWKDVFRYSFIPKMYIFGFGDEEVDTPDPLALIRQQAEANRLNVYTPTSSSVFGGPKNSLGLDSELRITESPEVQAQRERQQQLIASAQGNIDQTPVDFSNLSFGLPVPGQFDETAQRLGQEFFDQQLSFLNPEFQRRDERLAQNLANQGLVLGSQAYSQGTGDEAENQQLQLTRAARDAALLGEQIRGTRFGQQMQGRQQEVSEQFGPRAQAINELQALLGNAGQIQSQALQPNIAQVDTLGANNVALGAQAQNAANAQANNSALFGALGTLGGAALGGPLGSKAGGFIGGLLGN